MTVLVLVADVSSDWSHEEVLPATTCFTDIKQSLEVMMHRARTLI